MDTRIKIAIGVCIASLFIGVGAMYLDYQQNKNIQVATGQLETLFIKDIENAYASGQADAIKGDIRIKYINDTTVVYTKNPWNEGDTAAKWNNWQNREIHIDYSK